MAGTIPSLWPDDIKTDVLTPLAILRTQANALRQATRGLLEARVNSLTEDDREVHQLDIVAPALDYEHRILTVSHNKDLVYPAHVVLKGLPIAEVANDDQLMEKLREYLATIPVRSVISSLIARSNEHTNSPSSSAE